MADTGAPWNIPYVEPTDLVREYPAADEAQANAIAAGLDAAGSAGIGSNVVSTIKTNTFSSSSSSLVDVTGLTVTITPSSNTSKILVMATVTGQSSDVASSERAGFQLVRGSTLIAQGTAGTSSNPKNFTGMLPGRVTTTVAVKHSAVVFLDSPATDLATTYKVQVATAGGTIFINRMPANTLISAVSTITAIEVAA